MLDNIENFHSFPCKTECQVKHIKNCSVKNISCVSQQLNRMVVYLQQLLQQIKVFSETGQEFEKLVFESNGEVRKILDSKSILEHIQRLEPSGLSVLQMIDTKEGELFLEYVLNAKETELIREHFKILLSEKLHPTVFKQKAILTLDNWRKLFASKDLIKEVTDRFEKVSITNVADIDELKAINKAMKNLTESCDISIISTYPLELIEAINIFWHEMLKKQMELGSTDPQQRFENFFLDISGNKIVRETGKDGK